MCGRARWECVAGHGYVRGFGECWSQRVIGLVGQNAAVVGGGLVGYDGFISYSHAADGRLAPALQRGLQRLAKQWNSRRALHVFRDETGLSTNPHLWSAIETTLDESDWFVLLASPESAASEWVNKEVAHWVARKPVDHILPVVTDGVWEWDQNTNDFTADSTSVPPALRGTLQDEARHLDLRWARNETDLDLRNSRFRAAIADLAAPMHGIAKDDLEGEDIRQQKRARRLARTGVSAVVVLMIVALVFGAFAVSQRNQADRERNVAKQNAAESLTRGLATEAATLTESRHFDQALLVAAQAEETASRNGVATTAAQQARTALLNTLTASPTLAGFFEDQPDAPASLAYSPNGAYLISTTVAGQYHAWDATTGRELPRPRWHVGGAGGVVGLGNAAVNSVGIMATGSAGGRNLALWDLHKQRAVRLATAERAATGPGGAAVELGRAFRPRTGRVGVRRRPDDARRVGPRPAATRRHPAHLPRGARRPHLLARRAPTRGHARSLELGPHGPARLRARHDSRPAAPRTG